MQAPQDFNKSCGAFSYALFRHFDEGVGLWAYINTKGKRDFRVKVYANVPNVNDFFWR